MLKYVLKNLSSRNILNISLQFRKFQPWDRRWLYSKFQPGLKYSFEIYSYQCEVTTRAYIIMCIQVVLAATAANSFWSIEKGNVILKNYECHLLFLFLLVKRSVAETNCENLCESTGYERNQWVSPVTVYRNPGSQALYCHLFIFILCFVIEYFNMSAHLAVPVHIPQSLSTIQILCLSLFPD